MHPKSGASFVRSVFCSVAALSAITLWGAGHPPVRSYRSADFGTDSIVWSAVQGHDGVLYFGTSSVVSFDGQAWKVHPVPKTYAVRTMAVGAGGRLWIGAINEIGYFDLGAAGPSAFRSLRDQLPPDTGELGDLWSVFAERDGAVFFTQDRVLRWDGVRFTIWQMPSNRRLSAMRVGGDILFQQVTTGVWRLDAHGPKLVIPAAKLGSATVLWLEQTPDGYLIGSGAGLARWDGERLTPFAPAASAFIAKHTLAAMRRLRSGDIAVATLTGGLGILGPDGELRRVIGTEGDPPGRSILALFEDRDGALWMGTPDHVVRIRVNGGAASFDETKERFGNPVKCITSFQNTVALLTGEGVFRAEERSFENVRFEAVPKLSGIYFGIHGTAESLWVAGYKSVDLFTNGSLHRVMSGHADAQFVQPSSARPGTILCNEGFSLLRIESAAAGQPAKFHLIARLPDHPVAAVEDGKGSIWIATYSRGLFQVADQIDGPAPRPVALSPSDSGPSMVARVGQMTVGLTSSGAYLLESESKTPRRITAFPRLTVTAVSNPDASGGTWIAAKSRFGTAPEAIVVGRLAATHDQQATWEPLAVEGLEELGAVNTVFIDAQNTVWLGGNQGVLRLDPAKCETVKPPRPPLLRSSVAEGAALPADNHRLEFEFAVPEFGRVSSLRFQTSLSRGPEEWSEFTTSHAFSTGNLRSGTYRFQVRAVNAEGMTGPAATLGFTVSPPWYLQTGALVGFGAGLAVLTLGVVHWRSRRLSAHNAQLEVLVTQKTAQLEKANAAKTEFVANMSHEIRNPISGIMNLADEMGQTGLTAQQAEINRSTRNCADLLSALVVDVLDFAQIESDQFELHPTAFRIGPMLTDCLRMVQPDLTAPPTPVRIVMADTLPSWVRGDRARVQQIVLNYLTNALKFAPGREVIVGASDTLDGEIRFYVRDQGPGIPPAEQPELFEKFSRLKSAREGRVKGTGLGLAVCRKLARKMGGTVGVESQPGAGASFWVALPLPAAAEETGAAPAPDFSAASLRALVVEDFDYNAQALQAVLRRIGIPSDRAATGPEALERLRAAPYEVVFMDWDLPGLNGTEVTRRFRAGEPPGRRTCIIGTTANTTAENREACLQAGMDAFLTKPLKPEKVADTIRWLLGLGGTTGAPPPPESSGAEPEPDTLDLSLLEYFAQGAHSTLREQIDAYLAASEALILQTRQQLAGGAPPDELRRAGHRLASQGRMLNASGLTRVGHRFEAEAGADPAELSALLGEYERELAALREKLASHPGGAGPA